MSHAYLCGSALRVALELRNSQPQSVLRFCVFGGQRFAAEIRVARLAATICFSFLRFSRREPSGFCLEVFCRRTFFNPAKWHISAPPEGRIGPNSRVGPPSDSSYQGGPPRNRRFSGTVFLRGCYTISKQLLTTTTTA